VSTFTIQNEGEQALTPGTSALQVHLTVIRAGASRGRALPANYFHLGLLRFSINEWFLPTIPVDTEFQQIPVPRGATSVSWAMDGISEGEVTEIISTGDVGNPIRIERFAVVNVEPGPQETLWTYTVPQGRALSAQLVQGAIWAGAGPNSICQVSTSIAFLVLCYGRSSEQNGYWHVQNLPYAITFLGGDELVATASNGETQPVAVAATLEGIEYDHGPLITR
jgi:hypothetical protein